jgi:DNA-binding IclR family transcriptional regulator
MARYRVQPPARSSAAAGGVGAVDRALLVLGAFRKGDGPLQLAEIARRAGLVKSTTTRLLASLRHFGMVERLADGSYAIGLEIARLYEVYTSSFSMEQIVVPLMRELVRSTGEGASFHVRQGDKRLCLYRVESPHPLREHGHAGDMLPLDRGSGGRVLLAFSGADGDSYDQIRRDGIAIMVADRVPDLAGISAPVFAAHGRLVGAMTLTMPVTRFDPAHASHVLRIAAAATQRLGGNPMRMGAAEDGNVGGNLARS